MKAGARVRVLADWSTFRGQEGRVTATRPHLMVLLRDERQPMRFGETEVSEVSESDPHMVAGE